MFIHVDLMSVSSYQVSPILKKIPVCFKVRLLMFKIVSIYIYSCFVVEIRFSSLDSSKLKLCIKRDFFFYVHWLFFPIAVLLLFLIFSAFWLHLRRDLLFISLASYYFILLSCGKISLFIVSCIWVLFKLDVHFHLYPYCIFVSVFSMCWFCIPKLIVPVASWFTSWRDNRQGNYREFKFFSILPISA